MLNRQEQENVIQIVLQTKDLIYKELETAKVKRKGAADYVTNVDVAVQNYILNELHKLYPGIDMIAEEKVNEGLVREGSYWILDPIDGTTNLIHSYGQSAVALGLYEGGEITFGVVYNPFNDELFQAAKGQGAFLNGRQIFTSVIPDIKDAVINYGSSPYEKKEYGTYIFSVFQKLFMHTADFRRSGSAELDICYVACGRVEAYLEKNSKPWDYTAGSIVLTEAGGEISDWCGKEVPYLRNSDVLCCAKQFKDALLTIIE
ncbi:inositol monophosphatase family protein [Novisyntrophococcus fermenticellae]|uniref:inositol monophosphatase family protein n=1 Tax=Novisyntrophococcus fermenticellae TaxID=2068655 RepID=UPI001E2A4DD4|nr:inositol monophosphatase family protein [Novisyntrophococcus fermenticellae]